MAALLIAYILIEDARSSRLALGQNPHGQIAQLFLNEPLPLSYWAGPATEAGTPPTGGVADPATFCTWYRKAGSRCGGAGVPDAAGDGAGWCLAGALGPPTEARHSFAAPLAAPHRGAAALGRCSRSPRPRRGTMAARTSERAAHRMACLGGAAARRSL